MEQKELITISITCYGVEHKALTEDTLASIIDKTLTIMEHVGYPRQEVYQELKKEINNRL